MITVLRHATVCGVSMSNAPLILHDFSEHSDCCVNCGQHIVNRTPECVPTTAEPGCDDE